MSHLDDHDLILHYYGETGEPAAVERHLDGCSSCRAAYAALERVLNAVDAMPVPERGAAYEEETWRRLQPLVRPGFSPGRRAEARRQPGRDAPLWPAAFAFASLLLVALVVGRGFHPSRPPRVAADPQLQDRILKSAVADYLDRSGIVLIELVNSSPDGELDITAQQERAEDLLTENRLYQQTALRAGDNVVAGVLDELARVLLEIAHAPSRLEPSQIDELRRRLRSEGVLFRIRVLGATVRNQDEQKL